MKFRKRIRIAPGVVLNISKSGISTTIGPRGASVNIGKAGTYLNTGIPGTGLYDRQKIAGGKAARKPADPVARAPRTRTGGVLGWVVTLVILLAVVSWLLK